MDARQVAARFLGTRNLELRPLGHGKINRTWLVREARGGCYVLQALNTGVFRDPELVMDNLQALAVHMEQGLRTSPSPLARDWRVARPLSLPGGALLFRTDEAAFRMLRHVPGRVLERADAPARAAALGQALGFFHALCADMDMEALRSPLPGLHATPAWLARYRERVRGRERELPATLRAAVEELSPLAPVVGEAAARKGLAPRPVHGDPRMANAILHPERDQVVALIDLDTFGPGLVLHDLADCLRSCCHGPDGDLDLEHYAALLHGYAASHGLTAAEQDLLPAALGSLFLELGLRYLIDHLEGNRYFQVERPGQNLERASAQLRLGLAVWRDIQGPGRLRALTPSSLVSRDGRT